MLLYLLCNNVFTEAGDGDSSRKWSVVDGITPNVHTQVLCPRGLECLLDTSQLVVHMGNLRHDASMFIVLHLIIISMDTCTHDVRP